MKKLMSAIALLSISTTSFAAVYSSSDVKNRCTLYRVVNPSTTLQAQPNETLEFKKDVYGFSLQDLSIDFDNREAKAVLMMHVALGFNRPLLSSEAVIAAENKNFTSLINYTNRRINLLQKVCVNRDNEIIYSEADE